MAIVYVDATATGAADGSSWTDAFTTITAGAAGASATDTIEISGGTSGQTYAESSTITISQENHIKGSTESGHNGLVEWSTANNVCFINADDCSVSNLKITNNGTASKANFLIGSAVVNFHCFDVWSHNAAYHMWSLNTAGGAAVLTHDRCRFSDGLDYLLRGGQSTTEWVMNYCEMSDAGAGNAGGLVTAGVITYNNCSFEDSRFTVDPDGATQQFNNCIFLPNDNSNTGADYATAAAGSCTITNSIGFGTYIRPTPLALFTAESFVDGGGNLSGIAAYSAVGKVFETTRYPGVTYMMIDDLANIAHWSTLCAVAKSNGFKLGLGVTGDPTSGNYDTMAARIGDGSGYLVLHSKTTTNLDQDGPIQIAYGGAGTPTIDITNTGTDTDSSTWGSTLVLSVDASPVATLDLTAAANDTIGELVTVIGAVSNWTCQKTAGTAISDEVSSAVLKEVTDGAVTATITDTTVEWNTDRIFTEEVGDHMTKLETGLAAAGQPYTFKTFYPQGNAFTLALQTYLKDTMGLIGMRTNTDGDRTLSSYNVYQSMGLLAQQAFGTTSTASIKRNTAGWALDQGLMGYCTGIYSHGAGEFSVANWTDFMAELSDHNIQVMTFDDACEYIRQGTTSDGFTYTRTLNKNGPILSSDSALLNKGIRSFGSYDINGRPLDGTHIGPWAGKGRTTAATARTKAAARTDSSTRLIKSW